MARNFQQFTKSNLTVIYAHTELLTKCILMTLSGKWDGQQKKEMVDKYVKKYLNIY
jgi:hypothetical protein